MGQRAHQLSLIVIFFYTHLFETLALVLCGFIIQVMRCLMITLDTDGWALLVILSLGPTLFGYLLFKVSPVSVRPDRQSLSYSRTGHDSPARLLFSWAAS